MNAHTLSIKSCCLSPGQQAKFEAVLGDTLLIRDEKHLEEAELISLDDGKVVVRLWDGRTKEIVPTDIVALMLGD